ncbi:MAG: hypothetical protein P4L76_15365 [Beijerinckiaceae bacterium]|nr:hypothetical protein [Beijerinckiaceae bacterium]
MLEGLTDVAGTARSLKRVPMGVEGRHDEKWLQRLLFDHPELIPIDTIDLGAKEVIAVCREFSIPKEGATIFLDILAVTPHGRLVLVECKLWRNPQARREVIGQILEYASLLRRWNYADLSVRLNGSLKSHAANPLYDCVRKIRPDIEEATFVDAVSRSLAAGDFDLIIAGDGIRADLQAIAAHLNTFSGLTSRLALLEVQLWEDGTGATVVVPFVPYRTEVVQHRVIVDAVGVPLALATEMDEPDVSAPIVDADRKTQLEQNRAFWQKFIDTIRFDHADQSPPKHGGNNWVKISLPEPINWLTAYRNKTEAGVFIRFTKEAGQALFEELAQQAAELRAETTDALSFDVKSSDPFVAMISATKALTSADHLSESEQLSWLKRTANSVVSAVRLRLP